MLPVKAGSVKDLISLKIDRIANNYGRLKSLTRQRHDRFQTESQQLQPWTAVSILLDLVSKV